LRGKLARQRTGPSGHSPIGANGNGVYGTALLNGSTDTDYGNGYGNEWKET